MPEERREYELSHREFRVILNWFMVSDPWPMESESESVIKNLLNEESATRGYEDWVEAYHEFEV